MTCMSGVSEIGSCSLTLYMACIGLLTPLAKIPLPQNDTPPVLKFLIPPVLKLFTPFDWKQKILRCEANAQIFHPTYPLTNKKIK